MHIGDRIKKQRLRRGLSLRQLSELSGVDRGLLSRLERGERTEVTLSVATRIAQGLGVTLDYLAGMYEDEDDEPALALLALV